MALWAYIHLPQLQLESMYGGDADAPMAVVCAKQHRLVEINQCAAHAGLSVGMGVALAAAHCHRLQVVAKDDSRLSAQLEVLAEALYRVTSDILLLPERGISLRVTPMMKIYKDEQDYFAEVQRLLSEQGLSGQIACAPSCAMAQILAEQGCGKSSFDGLDAEQALGRLPLETLRLTAKQLSALKRLGLKNVAQLLAMPRQELAARFDAGLSHYLAELTGEYRPQQDFYLPPAQFSRELLLMYDIDDLKQLLKPLHSLLRHLEDFLRRRNARATEIHLRLHLREGEPLRLTIGSGEGEYKASVWLALCELRFAREALSAPVVELGLSASRVIDANGDESDLFDKRRMGVSRLSLLASLEARLGKAQVQGLKHNSAHHPLLANTYTKAFRPSAPQSALRRPLLLSLSPQPLCEQVSILAGPERLSIPWWEREALPESPPMMDYFIARSRQGQWLWVYRTQDKHWFVAGHFS